jgi:hypothetical protein
MGAAGGVGVPGLGGASRILVLDNAVEKGELADPEEYSGIVEDMEVRQGGEGGSW